MNYKSFLLCLCLLFLPIFSGAEENTAPLLKAQINPSDQASLQRGAKWFMNYCSGCHSLHYLRYNLMAEDLGIVDNNGNILASLVQSNLMFNTNKIAETIQTSMQTSDAVHWFGIAPPDLTLEARVRGADWIYTYLMSFYQDDTRPFGTNNWLKPDVAMPNVLLNLQGQQIAIYKIEKQNIQGKIISVRVIDHLALAKSGMMSSVQFNQTVNDLVNFLVYSSDPVREKREHLGIWVIGFLIVFAIFAYLLKREFWRDIK